MGYSALEKRFLNMDECSEYLGITKGTLYVWVCHKKIPYLKVGRLVKFDLKQLETWLKANTVAQLN
jgi:excisionase family DNA binding protein